MGDEPDRPGLTRFLVELGSSEAVSEAGHRAQLAVGPIDKTVQIAQDQEVTP